MQLKNKKINLFIGLKKKDLITNITKKHSLEVISKCLKKIKVTDYNIHFISGFWNAKAEKTLYISFINTENINYKQLTQAINAIKKELDQEAILVEIIAADYAFL